MECSLSGSVITYRLGGGRVLARDPMVKGETREEWKLKQARGREGGGGEMGGSRVSDFARDQQNSNPLYINT